MVFKVKLCSIGHLMSKFSSSKVKIGQKSCFLSKKNIIQVNIFSFSVKKLPKCWFFKVQLLTFGYPDENREFRYENDDFQSQTFSVFS